MYINRSKNSKVTALGHHQWLRLKSLNGKPTNVTRPNWSKEMLEPHERMTGQSRIEFVEKISGTSRIALRLVPCGRLWLDCLT